MTHTLSLDLIHPQPGLLAGFYGWDAGMYLVLAAGVGMLAWGAMKHKTGWIIPGGVLSGIGLGILLYEGPWQIPFTQQNGLFLLCFALGWFLITPLSRLFTPRTQWWALVPGGIMAVLGSAILLGQLP